MITIKFEGGTKEERKIVAAITAVVLTEEFDCLTEDVMPISCYADIADLREGVESDIVIIGEEYE